MKVIEFCIRNPKRSTHAPHDRFFEMAAELRGTTSPCASHPLALLLPRQCLFTAFLFFSFFIPLLGSQAPFYSLTQLFYIFFYFIAYSYSATTMTFYIIYGNTYDEARCSERYLHLTRNTAHSILKLIDGGTTKH